MKILLLISESWNDIKYPNNNMSNWFGGMKDVEIYTVSGGAEPQINSCCKNYFQVSDYDMLRSFLPWRRAGRIIRLNSYPQKETDIELSSVEKSIYAGRSKLQSWFPRLARDFIWRFGKYNKKKLKLFIDDFSPDIIFSQRMGSVKMCRMESMVKRLTNTPIVAYTGDNEYYVEAMPESIFGKVHAVWTRRWLDRQIPNYALYYSMSYEQMAFYKEKFGVNMKFLVKCGDFSSVSRHKEVNFPVKFVYAGKLYAGRWKTLALLANEIRNINRDKIRFSLDIYTPDRLTEEQNSLLNDGVSAFVHPKVKAEILPQIYAKSDVVLHIESLEDESKTTRFSFSTKIIDCLASGCAVMAICEKHQAGLVYLRDNNIAFTASDTNEIKDLLRSITDNNSLILEYADKAIKYGRQYHQKSVVQETMRADFEKVLEGYRC